MRLCSHLVGEMAFLDSLVGEILYGAKKLGYLEVLYPKQQQVVKQFLLGSDVFVSLPTGNRKSLCYCVLPNLFNHLLSRNSSNGSIVVVVSPLIALMQDQVWAMTEHGVRAVYAGDAEDTVEADMCAGLYQLVYFSPKLIVADRICCRPLYM